MFGWDRGPSRILHRCLSTADLSFAFNVELVLKTPLYILHLNLSRLCPDATFPKPSTSATLIAEMSKNVLMNEYKALAKEKWVEIEVIHSLWKSLGQIH